MQPVRNPAFTNSASNSDKSTNKHRQLPNIDIVPKTGHLSFRNYNQLLAKSPINAQHQTEINQVASEDDREFSSRLWIFNTALFIASLILLIFSIMAAVKFETREGCKVNYIAMKIFNKNVMLKEIFYTQLVAAIVPIFLLVISFIQYIFHNCGNLRSPYFRFFVAAVSIGGFAISSFLTYLTFMTPCTSNPYDMFKDLNFITNPIISTIIEVIRFGGKLVQVALEFIYNNLEINNVFEAHDKAGQLIFILNSLNVIIYATIYLSFLCI